MRTIGLALALLIAGVGAAAAQSNQKVDLGEEFSKWIRGDTSSAPSTPSGGLGSISSLVNDLLGGKKDKAPAAADATIAIEGMARADDANVLEITKADGSVVKVRQWGLEAPETKQWPWGPRARGELDRLLAASGGKVRCTSNGKTTRAGAVVARCFAGDADIAGTLIEAGYGVEWREVSGGAYTALEAGAQAAQRGVWSR